MLCVNKNELIKEQGNWSTNGLNVYCMHQWLSPKKKKKEERIQKEKSFPLSIQTNPHPNYLVSASHIHHAHLICSRFPSQNARNVPTERISIQHHITSLMPRSYINLAHKYSALPFFDYTYSPKLPRHASDLRH